MKKFIFLLLLVALFWSVFWSIGYSDLSNLSTMERQTYAIMANIKWLTVIMFYIAWQVTPESKDQ
jgi:hypothetical protein